MLPNIKTSAPASWSRGNLQFHNHCPACGESGVAHQRIYCRQDDYQSMPDIWCHSLCNACGSIYLNPRPDAESLPLAYADYYTHHASEDRTITGARATDKLVNGYLAWRFGIRQRPHWRAGAWLFRYVPPLRMKLDVYGRHIPRAWLGSPKRVLDVGCGNGAFLHRAIEMGFEAVGCELDPKAAALCQQQGLNVYAGDAFSPLLDDQRFDFITLNHVIEHVENPEKLLSRLHDLLLPSGWVWLALPNPQALGRFLYGKAWMGFHPPFHLLIPHQNTLMGWLRQAEFVDVKVVRRGAQSSSLRQVSKRMAEREGCSPNALIGALAQVGGDVLSTLTPRWGEETIIMARRRQQ